MERGLGGKPITDRLVSISDPDARPIRKGKLRKPTEFGYVMQLTELCENTRRGARGLILPASTGIGSLNEGHLLPATGQRLHDLHLRPRELALDGGFTPGPVRAYLPEPSGCSSAATTLHTRARPTAGWPSSASAPKAASATSSAATASTARA